MSETSVTDLSALQQLGNLSTLKLRGNRITDKAIEALAYSAQLTSLDLGLNQITDDGVKTLARLSQLTYLDLRGNQITDDGVRALASLSQTSSLFLGSNKITDKGALAIGALDKLKDLDLSETQVVDLKPFSNLTNLRRLNLIGNKVADLSPLKNLLLEGCEAKWEDQGDGILVKDCPLVRPPVEVVMQGHQAVLEYFRALDDIPDWADDPEYGDEDSDGKLSDARTKSVKTITIFLSASKGLRKERDEFEIYFRQQNDRYRKQGCYLEIVLWEDFFNTTSKFSLQDEFYRAIRKCDIFVSLIKDNIGRFAEEEFETAYTVFKETGKPKIYIYFMQTEVSTGRSDSETFVSLRDFQDRLKEFGHFYLVCENIEELKSQFEDQLNVVLEELTAESETSEREAQTAPDNLSQEDIAFIRDNMVGEWEIIHLINLLDPKPFRYTPRPQFKYELTHLLNKEMIERQLSKGRRSTMRDSGPNNDLHEHFYITEKGVRYLQLIEKLGLLAGHTKENIIEFLSPKDIAFVRDNMIGEWEIVHLTNLLDPKPFRYTPRPQFKYELTHLLNKEMIERRPSKGRRSAMGDSGPNNDLHEHFYITEKGERYLRLIEKLGSPKSSLPSATQSKVRQVFDAGNVVNRESNAFVARVAIVEALAAEIDLATSCPGIVLYGRRRVGKSTLLLNLRGFLRESVTPIYVSLQNAEVFTSLAHFTKTVCGEITRDAGLEKTLETEPRDLEEFAQMLKAIDQALGRAKQKALISLDEYEIIDLKIEQGVFPEELLAVFSESIQYHRNLIWLFAGSHEITELRASGWTSYLTDTQTVEVSFFRLEEVFELLTEPMRHCSVWSANEEGRPRFTREFWGAGGIERIYRETGGWPYLVQLVAQEAISLVIRSDVFSIDEALLEKAINLSVTAGHAVFFELLNRESRTQAEWDYLFGFAKNEWQEVPKDDDLSRALLRRSLVEQDGDGWRLKSTLMGRWLRERGDLPWLGGRG